MAVSATSAWAIRQEDQSPLGGVRWGRSRADGVISILIYVRAASSKRYSLTVLPSASKQISLRQETYSPDASPSPQQGTRPFIPHPHPTACSPTPVGSSALPKHQPTTSATTRARNLLGPSMPPPSLQEIYSPYAFSLPAGNLLPPSPLLYTCTPPSPPPHSPSPARNLLASKRAGSPDPGNLLPEIAPANPLPGPAPLPALRRKQLQTLRIQPLSLPGGNLQRGAARVHPPSPSGNLLPVCMHRLSAIA